MFLMEPYMKLGWCRCIVFLLLLFTFIDHHFPTHEVNNNKTFQHVMLTNYLCIDAYTVRRRMSSHGLARFSSYGSHNSFKIMAQRVCHGTDFKGSPGLIVLKTVGEDKSNIHRKLIKWIVLVCLQLVSDYNQIHRMRDNFVIVNKIFRNFMNIVIEWTCCWNRNSSLSSYFMVSKIFQN